MMVHRRGRSWSKQKTDCATPSHAGLQRRRAPQRFRCPGAHHAKRGRYLDRHRRRDRAATTANTPRTKCRNSPKLARAEGVEAGIKIGLARASNGGGNGHLTLPKPVEMAEYCHERLGRLKDDKQRDFIGEMYVITQQEVRLSPGRLGYLASIYIQIGGKT